MSDTEMKYAPASPSPPPSGAFKGASRASNLEEQIQARIREVEQQGLLPYPPAGGISSRTNRPVPPPPPPPPGLAPYNPALAVSKRLESALSVYGNPSQTLYVNNLNDKTRKQELKLCLYSLFSTYGRVIDVVAVKTPKMRGQAHIVFNDVPSATQALRALQGSLFLGKELKISFAKTKSDAVAKRDGTYRLPPPPGLNPSTLPEYTDTPTGTKRPREESEE